MKKIIRSLALIILTVSSSSLAAQFFQPVGNGLNPNQQNFSAKDDYVQGRDLLDSEK